MKCQTFYVILNVRKNTKIALIIKSLIMITDVEIGSNLMLNLKIKLSFLNHILFQLEIYSRLLYV